MDEKLIELVSKNEVLYNTSHKLYKDLAVRDDVWLAIAGIIGKDDIVEVAQRNGILRFSSTKKLQMLSTGTIITFEKIIVKKVNDCKTRWRSLRDLYHRKKKDVKRGKKLRSPWEYMERLSFIDEFTSEKKCENVEDINEYDNDDKSFQVPSKYMNIIALPFNVSDSNIDKFRRSNEEIEEGCTKKIKNETPHAEDKEDNECVQLLREIRDATAQQHPIKMFFDSMANTVMSFPPALAAEAKLKVCQIVTELECRILDETEYIDTENAGYF